MAATSPYSQNDYQVFNYRGFNLPVDSMFKAFQAQDAFWKEGAQRVDSVYNEALALKLSLEPNKEIRRKFLEQADQQLSKLAAKDLSDPSVQKQGFGIFKNLFNDEGIIYDDAMTRHYEKVRADALSYRSKDGGKAYSDTNLSYAMDGYKDFINSKDRFAGKKFYEDRKEYTPFYDPSIELGNVMKYCKPSTAYNEGTKGFYMHSYSEESLTSAKVNTCLDGGLSDRAKRQLQINGYVTYKNNPLALRDKYIPHLNGTITQLEEETSAIKGVLANKNNLKNLKKADLEKLGIEDISEITPELISTLDSTVKANDARVHNMRESVRKMLNGDLTDISGTNFEPVAGAVYSRDYTQNVAEGFSYNFSKNTMRADPVQMMFYQQGLQNARQEDQQQFEMEKLDKQLHNDLMIKMMQQNQASGNIKKMLTGAGGNIAEELLEQARSFSPSTSPFTQIEKTDSYDKITEERVKIATEREGVNKWLINKLKKYGLDANVGHTDDPRFNNFWQNFKTTSKGDPVKDQIVNEYYGKMSPLVATEDLYRKTQENVDKRIRPINQRIDNELKGIDPVTIKLQVKDENGRAVWRNVTVRPEDLVDQVVNQDKHGWIVSKGFNVAGQNINHLNSNDNYQKLRSLANQIASGHKKALGELKTERSKLIDEETVLQREEYNFAWMNSNQLADPQKGEIPGFKETLAGKLNIPLKHIDDLNVGETDLEGRLVISLNRDRKKIAEDYNVDQVIQNIKNYGGGNNKETEDGRFVLENISQLDVIKRDDLSSIMGPYVRRLENNSSISQTQSTPFLRADNGREYRLEVGKTVNGGHDYTIIDSSSPTSPVAVFYDRTAALENFENILGRTGSQQIKPQ